MPYRIALTLVAVFACAAFAMAFQNCGGNAFEQQTARIGTEPHRTN